MIRKFKSSFSRRVSKESEVKLTEYTKAKIDRNDDETTISGQRSAIEGISSAPRIGITVN